MIDYCELLTSFLTGASSSLGRGFVRKLYRWSCVSKTDHPLITNDACKIVRLIDQPELLSFSSAGIPEGFAVSRFSDLRWKQTYEEGFALPPNVKEGETFWLVPSEPKVFNTTIKIDTGELLAGYGLELVPFQGLETIIMNHIDLTWEKVGAFVIELLTASVSVSSPESELSNQIEPWLLNLNSGLKSFGLRCTGITLDQAPQFESSEGKELVSEFKKLNNKDQLDELIKSLNIGQSASEQLSIFHEHSVNPELLLQKLAESASTACTNAGISVPDLERWSRLEECLNEEPSTLNPETPSGLKVEHSKKPSVWFTWNREDLDRKMVGYIKSTIDRSISTCQTTLRRQSNDMSSMRQFRDLLNELQLTKDLIASTPLLFVKSSGLQLKSWQVKDALKSSEMAVLESQNLRTRLSGLFSQPAGSHQWNQEMNDCFVSISSLTQHLQSRRQIRG